MKTSKLIKDVMSVYQALAPRFLLPIPVGNKDNTEIIIFGSIMERIKVAAQLESRDMKKKKRLGIYVFLLAMLWRKLPPSSEGVTRLYQLL